jgi:hypothetical protein
MDTPDLAQLHSVITRYSIEQPLLRSLADFPESMQYLVTSGEQAVDCWSALRSLTTKTGLWPVILGEPIAFNLLIAGFAFDQQQTVPVGTILEAARAIDPHAWLREALAQNDVEGEPWDTTEGEYAIRSVWPDDVLPATTLSLPFDWQTQAPYKTVMVGLVPTRTGWELPAYLRFGSYNACPSPAEHVSVLRRWCTQFDAEIVGVSYEVIELRVGSPPNDRDHALALAYEQFAYCPDIVDQGVGTLDALAATLLHGTVWYFWWD